MKRPSPGLSFVLVMLATACRESPSPAPPSSASAAPAPPPSVAEETPACVHRRPFADSDKPLVLPAPFNVLTPCDLVKPLTAADLAGGGRVRIDHVRRWDVHGRSLLAALYYRGEDADGKVLCETCRVAVHLALFERRGASVVLAVQAPSPRQPGPEARALFNGRADFGAELPLDGTESMLAVKTPWSSGAPGTHTHLTLYRLVGDEAKIVFEQAVDWQAIDKGMGENDEVVSAVTTAPRSGGANDLVLTTTELRCHYDYGSYEPSPICRPSEQVGKERWRFDEIAYQRVEGKPAPLPRVLHERWGW